MAAKKMVGALLFSMILAACGGDSGSSTHDGEESGIASVENFESLPHCIKSRYGEVVLVKSENSYFECTSEDWVEADPAKVDSILTAESSSAADSSSLRSSSSVKVSEKDTASVEIHKVDAVTIKGFAQKGPFSSGTTVSVFGLDQELEKTREKFTGKVEGDIGAYVVKDVTLESQYALVQVTGFYMNEVSGKKTSGTRTTVSAIVDLSASKTVTANVNLFTELEYARVKQLVTAEKFNVPAAKKRATGELLAAFGADASVADGAVLTATGLSLGDTTAAGQVLLSATVLLQGDLSASKFGRMLGNVGELFAKTGSLDSAEFLVGLADWASKVDSTDNFAQIRENVKSMKLASTVPDFESILYVFWTGEYGLDACTDELESTIKKNTNKLSENYGAGYACTAKRWHKATALDTELGLCTGKMEGTFKEYNGNKTPEYYVCKAGTWNEISETQYELKECTDKRNDEYVATKSKEYFACVNRQWIELDAVTYELKLCTEKRAYEVAATKKNGSYVCRYDGKEGSWEQLNELESDIGVCGGKDVKADSIYKTTDGKYYRCTSGNWVDAEQLSYELQPAGACTEENNLTTFETETLGLFVCEGKVWREATDVESNLGVCGGKDVKADSIYKTLDGNYYQCASGSWIEAEQLSYELQPAGACTEENNLVTFDTETLGRFVCDNKAWREVTDAELELGFCGSEGVADSTLGATTTGNYYICLAAEWVAIDERTFKLGFCKEANQDTIIWTGDFYENLGEGNIPVLDGSSEGEFYRCNNGAWEATDNIHYFYGTTCERALSKEVFPSMTTSDGVFDSRKNPLLLTRFFGSSGGLTEEENNAYEQMFTVGDVAYSNVLCQDDEWKMVSSTDLAMRKVCVDSLEGYKGLARMANGDYITDASGNYVTTGYSCSKQGWERALVDSRDSVVYRIVTIGSQTWMAENLNYDYKRNDMKTRCPGDSLNGCKKYGRLYLWSAAFDSLALFSNSSAGCGADYYTCKCEINGDRARGVCPDGWHLPDTLETRELFKNAGANDEGINFNEVDYAMLVGKRLRAKTDWTVAEAGTDDFGFSLLPAGVYVGGKHFPTQTAFAAWRRYNDPIKVYFMEFLFYPEGSGIYGYYAYENMFQYHHDNPTEYLSVRCIKDE